MIDKTTALLKGLRRKIVRVSGDAVKIIKRQETRQRGRPEIVVVREFGLRRKRPSEDLREEAKQSSAGVFDGTVPQAYSAQVNEVQEDSGQHHALRHPPEDKVQEENIRDVEWPAPVPRVTRPRVQQRPRGLVIDHEALAEIEELESAISPTNTNLPFRTPPESRSRVDLRSEESGAGHGGLQRASLAEGSQRRATIASSYGCVESQERFDSYVDAINDEDARRCSVHAMLSTDIARLVAELDVLHNRVAMAKMRTAYHRRATSDDLNTRPESWAAGTKPISYTCSCGQRFELRPEDTKVKRQTWHAGTSQQPRTRSQESETKQEVILRYSAGTNLFRLSLYEGQKENRPRGRTPDREVKQAVPQVDLSKSFDFRRECERIFRRIRPTFSVKRS